MNNDILAKLAQNPWITLIGFVVTLTSFVAAIFFYVRARKFKCPALAKRTVVLVEALQSRVRDVSVLYRGNPVENLAVTKIALWNAGKEPVLESDVASLDPLRLSAATGVRILEASILYQKNSTNNFRLGDQNQLGEVPVAFEFFRQAEGIVIQVIHTGAKNSDVRLIGTFKEVEEIKYYALPNLKRYLDLLPFPKRTKYITEKVMRRIFGVAAIIAPIISGIPILFDPITSKGSLPPIWARAIIVVVIAFVYWSMAYSLLRRRTPSGFDDFLHDDTAKDA
jgi:hypothetical protein